MPFDGNRRRLFTLAGLAVFVIVTGAHAQTGKPIASRFPGPDQSFEVASVKANRFVLPGNTGRMREAMDELLRAFLIDFAAANPR